MPESAPALLEGGRGAVVVAFPTETLLVVLVPAVAGVAFPTETLLVVFVPDVAGVVVVMLCVPAVLLPTVVLWLTVVALGTGIP